MNTRTHWFAVHLALLAFGTGLGSMPSVARAQAEDEAGDDETPSPDSEKTGIVTITRVSGAGSDRAAGFIAHHVREHFRDDPRYTVKSLATALGDASAETARLELQAAVESAERGREAFFNLELDTAVESLNAAVRAYDNNAAYVTDFRPVAETLLLLGATHILRQQESRGRDRRDEEQRGKQRFSQAAILFPEIEPDARIVNPDMRAIFDEAKNEVLGGRRGSLVIETEPTGAELYLDGQFIGVSPETVLDVAQGPHYLRAVKDGRRPFGMKSADIRGTVEITDRAVLPMTKSFDAFDQLCDRIFKGLNDGKKPRGVETLLEQLSALTDVDDLFLVEVRIDGEQVRVLAGQFNLSGQLMSRVRETRFVYDADGGSYAQRIERFLRREFAPPSESAGGADSVQWDEQSIDLTATPRCFGMNCDTFRTNVLLIGGATAIAAAGTGLVFGILADSDNSEFQDTPQVDPRAEELEDSGKGRALVADVLYGTGAVLALTSLGIYFFYRPSTSAADIVEGRLGSAFSLVPTRSRGGMLMGTWDF